MAKKGPLDLGFSVQGGQRMDLSMLVALVKDAWRPDMKCRLFEHEATCLFRCSLCLCWSSEVEAEDAWESTSAEA